MRRLLESRCISILTFGSLVTSFGCSSDPAGESGSSGGAAQGGALGNGGSSASTGGSSGSSGATGFGGAGTSGASSSGSGGGVNTGGATSSGGTTTTAGGSSGASGSAGTTAGAGAGNTNTGGGSGAAGSGGSGTAGSGAGGGSAGSAGTSGGSIDVGGSGGGSACGSGLSSCGKSCVNLQTDNANCGSCNAACSGGRTCMKGACQCPTTGCAALPAFPGADGAAINVSGGRGGSVYHVTKLDANFSDLTEGTLRYGLQSLTGPRTIVFDVSGVFSLGRVAVDGWNSNGNGWDTACRYNIPADVTIAGQTAPGPVIIMGGTTKPGGTNIILRNVTFAPGYGARSFDEPTKPPVSGDFPDSYVYDALDISGQNVIIDHVTTVYATDETVSMNETANNITVQYSTIAQGQNYPQSDAESSGVKYTGHALGSLFQAGSSAKISILHNFYAHLKGRLPRVGTESDKLTTAGVGPYHDFRNNVFYNWLGTAGTGASGQYSQNNFVANFYLAGDGGDDASGGESTGITTSAGGTAIFSGSDATNIKVYQSGNLKDTNKDADAEDTTALTSSDFASSALQSGAYTQTPYSGVTDTAAVAFQRVLDYAGAFWWNRAAIDKRLVSEARAGTGKIVAWADDPFNTSASEGTEWRALVATPLVARPAGFDTDNDGMPNTWETAHGLNPNLADNNGDFDSDGYTNLEEYINELAAWPAPAQAVFSAETNQRYAQISNWTLAPSRAHRGTSATAHWQPSRYDTAQIRAGECVVDATGQHAGTLEIASSTSAGANFNLVGGWLDVAARVELGRYSTSEVKGATRWVVGEARVNQTGGRLRAGTAVVVGGAHGRSAVYQLLGGELQTGLLSQGRAGGRFVFGGGTLQASVIDFSLKNEGGVLAPGPEIGTTTVLADLNLERGALLIELDGSRSDAVNVKGHVKLGGALRVELAGEGGRMPAEGAVWTILTARGGVSGTFSEVPAGFAVDIVDGRVLLRYGASSIASFGGTAKTRGTAG